MFNYKTFYANDELNKIVFESYNRGYSLEDTLKIYNSSKKDIDHKEQYCASYIKVLFKKFNKHKNLKGLPFNKLDDFQLVILFRFIQNNKPWAFLPQRLIASVLGISQKTVSRKLKKLVDAKVIRLVKRYKYFQKKADEYVLTNSGYKLVLKMIKGYKKEFFEFKTQAFERLNFSWFKKEKVTEEYIEPEDNFKLALDLYTKGWTLERVLKFFPSYKERLLSYELQLS